MRRRFSILLVTSSIACGCAAGLAAPAALASGSGGVTISNPAAASPTQPSFNLNNAGAAALQTTTVSSSPGTAATSSGGGIGTSGVIVIGAVFAGLMAGIIVLVRNDSRRTLSHLRHGHANRDEPMFATAHSGSKAHRKSRKLTPAERKRRKRGKAR